MSKILITGGAGHIGSILTRFLLEKNYSVRLADKFLFGKESLKDIWDNSLLEIIEIDLNKTESFKSLFKDVSTIIHLAAVVGDPACANNAELAIDTNLYMLKRLAAEAKKTGVKNFIFSSTCSVYGSSGDDLLDESSPLNPISLYGETKVQGEQFLLNLKDNSFNPFILRLATIFGISPRPRFDLVINYLTARLYYEKSAKIFGGDQWRPFIHVADAASVFSHFTDLIQEGLDSLVINIGKDKFNYKMKELIPIYAKILPSTKLNLETTIIDERSYRVCFSKLHSMGFNIDKDIPSGIMELKNAFEAGKIKNYKNIKYYNYIPPQ